MLLQGDTATSIVVGLSIGAAVLAVLIALVVLVFLIRSRRTSPAAELDLLLRESTQRTEAMVADLAGALERAREESERSHRLAAIGASIDFDDVLANALEAARRLPAVDAAMIVVPQAEREDEPVVAMVGMSAEEAARQSATNPGTADGTQARALTVRYRYPAEEGAAESPISGGIVVPIPAPGGDSLGTLGVFWRGVDRDVSDEEVAAIEEVAKRAGPAIENARRFREARQLADLDALTGLHNRRFFHETLAREVTRAQRYERSLALIVFDIDDFKAINDKVGHLAGDAVLAQVAERVQSVVRGSDVACRVGGDEFAVILPESTLQDAEQLYRRLQFAVASRPAGAAERIHLSAGIAEFVPSDDAVSFFERSDEALYRAKDAGKGQVVAATTQG
jgi:two-component system cell cycle response regulator